jgi:lipopolysaccharide transport system permease protein
MSADNITTYEPEDRLKQGYLTTVGEILHEISQNRWLTFQLFKRDLSSLYKQSLIGILWVFIIPIVTVGTFIVLNRSGVFNIGNVGVPYAIYAILGVAFWQLFSTGLVAGSNSLSSAGNMITKINFSRKSLVIASSGQALLSFVIQFSLLLPLFVFYSYPPSAAILLVPLLIVPLLLLTLGLGFVLSLLSGVVKDISLVLSVVMTFLLFLTPILYAKPETGAIATLANYNPIYYLISVPRDLVLTGSTSAWVGFIIAVAISLIVFIVGILTFHLSEIRVAERM